MKSLTPAKLMLTAYYAHCMAFLALLDLLQSIPCNCPKCNPSVWN